MNALKDQNIIKRIQQVYINVTFGYLYNDFCLVINHSISTCRLIFFISVVKKKKPENPVSIEIDSK